MFARLSLACAVATSLACGGSIFEAPDGGAAGGSGGGSAGGFAGGSGGGSAGGFAGGSGGGSAGGFAGGSGGGSAGGFAGGSGGGSSDGTAFCVDGPMNPSFGTLSTGLSKSIALTLRNCGSTELLVVELALVPVAPTTGQFTLSSGTLPQAGTTLEPGATVPLQITYTAGAAETDSAQLNYDVVHGADGVQGSVQLSGAAVAPVCGTNRANPTVAISTGYGGSQTGPFTTFNPATTSAPFDSYVQLSGAGSKVASGARSFIWTLVSGPAGVTTGEISDADLVVAQASIAGSYVVQLQVEDAYGCKATQQLTLKVAPQVVTPDQIHIELTWPEACGDLDLIYVAPGGAVCTQDQCFGGNLNPDWGCATSGCGAEGDPGGQYPDGTNVDDPVLDHDAHWGGAENITQESPFDSPAASPYQVWVAYASNVPDDGGGETGTCGVTHPSVSIYVGGVLKQTFTLSAGLATTSDLWNPANIAVSNGRQTVTVIPAATTSIDGTALCGG